MPSLDPRAVLGLPVVYRLFKRIAIPDANLRRFLREGVGIREGARVLDIGCGVGDVLDYLPAVDYHGFDGSEGYIAAARARYGDRAKFTCALVGRYSLGELEGTCDVAMATGVLHHLDDAEAKALIEVARAALKPGGRLVTMDPCFVDGQNPIARFIVSKDRGEHVRTEEEWLRLARSVLPDVKARVRTDLLRIPYTHIVLEARMP
ncbi:MAG: class I SAM-dependent methyltransferase [Deltaproteobacteria bacterium]|nr:class I SAM-dependent methyltransferase [Deltaproteobacteria bacterium]MBW2447476.1 class I SAM-dependent methyltransferase [Deltaproteobacteria bacterium]